MRGIPCCFPSSAETVHVLVCPVHALPFFTEPLLTVCCPFGRCEILNRPVPVSRDRDAKRSRSTAIRPPCGPECTTYNCSMQNVQKLHISHNLASANRASAFLQSSSALKITFALTAIASASAVPSCPASAMPVCGGAASVGRPCSVVSLARTAGEKGRSTSHFGLEIGNGLPANPVWPERSTCRLSLVRTVYHLVQFGEDGLPAGPV